MQKTAFVPAPQVQSHARVAAAAGTAAALGAAPAFADEIGTAASKLSDAAYPFMRDVDWNSMLYLQKPGGSAGALEWLKAIDSAMVMGASMDAKLLKEGALAHHRAISSVDGSGVLSKGAFTDVNAAIGRLIASVPESMTMDVYNTFSGLVGSDVPAYLKSTVKGADAEAAYSALMTFKDTVKTHPITPTPAAEPTIASAKLDAVGAAAGKLSAASYPFIKDIDWTSDLFSVPLPGVTAGAALKAVDKAILMGAAMDPKLLQEAVMAHHKAIGSVDAKGVTSAADYEAVNAALGKVIASVPTNQVMDVFFAFQKLLGNGLVANKAYATFNSGGDAIASYKALMEFKDVVKAAQI